MNSDFRAVPGDVYVSASAVGRFLVLMIAELRERVQSGRGDPGTKLVVAVSLASGQAFAMPLSEWMQSAVWPDGETRFKFVPEDAVKAVVR